MATELKVLLIDAGSGFYRVVRYPLGDFFGPVDLGLHLAGKHNALSFGVGLFAGSILPGSNRLIFTGFSPCWGGFFVSSMGGAGLIFDNLGVNLVSIIGRASVPSALVLNREHGEEIEVALEPVDLARAWREGDRPGVYGLLDHVLARHAARYKETPRLLAVGPAAQATDFGAIGSAPVERGRLTSVDTWAGRGGFGSKLLREHNVAAVIYGGTVVDEDFRDRKVADEWFQARYQKRLAVKDFEATTKYRFDPQLATGGTFGVNFASLGGAMLSFNSRSIYLDEPARLEIHRRLVLEHYLKQFNEETIAGKKQHTCGEPCAAVCKKTWGEFKKDYEPYQTLGPQSGIFDQRAAERVNHHADAAGFDAISAGGVVSWLLECLADGHLTPEDLGVEGRPVFSPEGFRPVEDSARNADLAIALLDGILARRGALDLSQGARRRARRLARVKGREVLDCFLYTAFARKGWMVPNQYWTPGALSPMPIMGKYYMHYAQEFLPPRELGRRNAERFRRELVLDDLGMCRFHRAWAEDMLPEVVEKLYGCGEAFTAGVARTASRIASRNASVLWEPRRNRDFVHRFLRRHADLEGSGGDLGRWLARFDADPDEAALEYWYEIHKGAMESLREF